MLDPNNGYSCIQLLALSIVSVAGGHLENSVAGDNRDWAVVTLVQWPCLVLLT